MGKELTAPAITRLDLIHNHNGLVFRTERTQLLHEAVGRYLNTTNALNTFDDNRRDIPLLQLSLKSIRIVQRQIGHRQILVDRCNDLRIIRHTHGSRRTAMEGMTQGQHPLFAIVERCQLQGILVGLCTGVDQKERILVIATRLAQFVGQGLLQTVDDRVGVEAQLAHLLRDRLHIGRMAMTYGNHGMTTIQVQVLVSLLVPHMTTLSFDNLDIE